MFYPLPGLTLKKYPNISPNCPPPPYLLGRGEYLVLIKKRVALILDFAINSPIFIQFIILKILRNTIFYVKTFLKKVKAKKKMKKKNFKFFIFIAT